MASCPVTGANFNQWRVRFIVAKVKGYWTTGVEVAALGWIRRTRQIATNDNALTITFLTGVWLWYG